MGSVEEFDQLNDIKPPEGTPKINCYIGIPSYMGGTEPKCQTCIDELIMYEINRGNVITAPPARAFGSNIAVNRYNLVKHAIMMDAEWILFIDSDTVFPPNLLERLQSHGKDMVTAIVHAKQPPHVPMIVHRPDERTWVNITKYPPDSLIKVDCCGGGCFMVRTEVFKKIKKPWFAMPAVGDMLVLNAAEKLRNHEGDPTEIVNEIKEKLAISGLEGHVLGEDYYFCNKLTQAGIEIWADTSLELGHVGKYVFDVGDMAKYAKSGRFDRNNTLYGFTDGTEGTK